MRDREMDEQYIRETLKKLGSDELVYVTPNTYDGGYEVRMGTLDFFVDYETIDAKDETHLCGLISR